MPFPTSEYASAMGGLRLSRRRFAQLFTVAASAAVLASCNRVTSQTAPTSAPTAPAVPQPTVAPTTSTSAPTALGTPAAGLARIGGTVSVIGTWGGSEQDSFMAMVKPFEDQTGTQVQYEGTRDLNALLTTRVQGGNPPDLAGLPGPGQMAEFARAGHLVDLDQVLDMAAMRQQYSEEWLKLASVDSKQVGIFIKAALKGPIWYDPKTFKDVHTGAPPATWDELMSLSHKIAASGTTPWTVGLEAGAASGWPGTDWIEDILMRQAGPDVYDQWWQGKLAWTSSQVKTAWQTWGKIIGDPKMVYGGAPYMLSTNFGDAGNVMFTTPPGAYMYHQASFITDFFVKNNPGVKPVEDFNFFPFPDINPQFAGAQEIAGDLFGMFHETPQSRALITYLTTPEAQAIWVERGGAISPNQHVPLDVYPDQISRELAQALIKARTPLFDASDQMPDAVNKAFWKGILDYVQRPDELDSILETLEQARHSAYPG